MGPIVDIITLARVCPGTIVAVTAADLVASQNKLIDEKAKRIEAALSKPGNIELRTREEVLKTLNVSPTTLWRWNKSGYLVPINVGGQSRYKSTDIDEILEGKR